MVPVFVKGKTPVDLGKKFNNKPLFGSHKTYQGFISAIVAAVIVTFLQTQLSSIFFFNSISILNYNDINFIAFGFLFGFGAMFGDLIKSFFKRRFNIKPGSRFIPFDQLDFVIGSLLFISLVYIPTPEIIITVLILTFFLHIISNHIGYYLKIRDVRW